MAKQLRSLPPLINRPRKIDYTLTRKPWTKRERTFALSLMRRAAYIAERNGDSLSNTAVLWRLLWLGAHDPRRKAGPSSSFDGYARERQRQTVARKLAQR